MFNSSFPQRFFPPRICSHHFLVLCGLPMPCWEHPGPPQSRAAGKSGSNGIMESPGLGGSTRIMECSSWPQNPTLSIPESVFIEYMGFLWKYLVSPHTPATLFSPFFFPFRISQLQVNSRWFKQHRNIVIYAEPLPASLTDSLCSLSHFLGQQFQH